MLDFVQFDFGQFDFGQLAEVEIGRSGNWPKSKLIGRNRTDGVCSVSSFSLSFFFFCFVFTFLHFFLVLTHLLFILFLWVYFFVIHPNPILHFAPFLSTHFFPCLNPIFKNGSFLSVVALVSVIFRFESPLLRGKKILARTATIELPECQERRGAKTIKSVFL